MNSYSLRQQLDVTHYGLHAVKDAVISYVERDHRGRKPLLCLCGPAGTGKTSLCKSVAAGLGAACELIKLAHGDSAQALAERIAAAAAAHSGSVAIIIDELYLLKQADSAALARVLAACSSHNVMLNMATALRKELIAPALHDVIDVVQVSGYTPEQRREAAAMLWRRALAKYKLPNSITIDSAALEAVVEKRYRRYNQQGLRIIAHNLALIAHRAKREHAGESFVVDREYAEKAMWVEPTAEAQLILENGIVRLTIIIPFLNEGKEVAETLRSIADTATGSPSVILINDGSTDGYGYRAVAERYGCRYVEHATRMGVAASRDEGVSLAETPYVLLLDAHMVAYHRGWDERLVSLLEATPRAVLCSQTVPLSQSREQKGKPCTYGAIIDFNGLKAKWAKRDPAPGSDVCEVGCILGAAYAMRKDYYQRLHGLRGLAGYGSDEELLSLKVRCEGGRCMLVKNWLTGHIYRTGKAAPFPRSAVDACYNKLLIAELFFEAPAKGKVVDAIRRSYGACYNAALQMLRERGNFVGAEKGYLRSIFDKKKLQELWNDCERERSAGEGKTAELATCTSSCEYDG